MQQFLFKAGAKVATATGIGVKRLFCVVAIYNCAEIVTVIVPSLRTENAQLRIMSAPPVRSMVPTRSETPGAKLPNPTTPEVPPFRLGLLSL
mgnify:CR=1 FL=1